MLKQGTGVAETSTSDALSQPIDDERNKCTDNGSDEQVANIVHAEIDARIGIDRRPKEDKHYKHSPTDYERQNRGKSERIGSVTRGKTVYAAAVIAYDVNHTGYRIIKICRAQSFRQGSKQAGARNVGKGNAQDYCHRKERCSALVEVGI